MPLDVGCLFFSPQFDRQNASTEKENYKEVEEEKKKKIKYTSSILIFRLLELSAIKKKKNVMFDIEQVRGHFVMFLY